MIIVEIISPGCKQQTAETSHLEAGGGPECTPRRPPVRHEALQRVEHALPQRQQRLRRWRRDVLDQRQPPAGRDDAANLRQRRGGRRDGAQHLPRTHAEVDEMNRMNRRVRWRSMAACAASSQAAIAALAARS
jgi:hypothetical protein